MPLEAVADAGRFDAKEGGGRDLPDLELTAGCGGMMEDRRRLRGGGASSELRVDVEVSGIGFLAGTFEEVLGREEGRRLLAVAALGTAVAFFFGVGFGFIGIVLVAY